MTREDIPGKISSKNKWKPKDFVFQKYIYVPNKPELKTFLNYIQISFYGGIIIFSIFL